MSFTIDIIEGGNTYSLTAYEPFVEDVYGEESRLFASVLRDEFQPVIQSITVSNAEVQFFDFGSLEFAGRLVDYVNKDDRVELEVGTFEEDAIVAQPTDSTFEFVGVADTDIVSNAISRVPTLSEGTLESEDNNVDFLFSNASPAKMIRAVQRETGNFVRYQPDGSVDYLCNCGEDKTGTVISPSQSNVSESFDVNEYDREDYNNLRVLGASQGDSQIQAEATVSTFDPSTDRAIWKTYSDKEITSVSRAQKVANTIISEYENASIRVDVQTVVFGLEVNIGDVFTVQSDRDNLNQELTAVEVTQRFEGTQDVYEVVFSNRLLTRLGDAEKQRRDVEKFNQAFQGDVVTLSSGGYRAPVDSNNSYVLSVRRPSDVVQELTAEIEVIGLPYRFYSSPIAHTHDVDIDIPTHTHNVNVDIPAHNHDVAFRIDDHSHNVDIDIPNHTHDFRVDTRSTNANQGTSVVSGGDYAQNLDNTGGNWIDIEVMIPNEDYQRLYVYISVDDADETVALRLANSFVASDEVQTYIPAFQGLPVPRVSSAQDRNANIVLIYPRDVGGVDLQYRTINDPNTQLDVRWVATEPHTHDVSQFSSTTSNGGSEFITETTDDGGADVVVDTTEDGGSEFLSETSNSGGGFFSSETTSSTAGVDAGIEETTDTPSNVDIIVNGNTVATNVASGQFSEVVDIAGQLTEGFNTIEVQSDSLGHIRATVFQDLYRQITQ